MMQNVSFHTLAGLCLLSLTLVASAQPESVTTIDATHSSFESGVHAQDSDPSLSPEELDLGISRDRVRELMDGAAVDAASPLSRQLNPSRNEKPDTLIYDASEVEQRAQSLKSKLNALWGQEAPDETSDEERELSLQREIALDKSYAGASSGQGGTPNRRSDLNNPTLKLRLIEVVLIVWDVVTHPLTIALLVLAFIARITLAIVRLSREESGRRSHRTSGSGTIASEAPVKHANTTAPPPSEQPLTEYEQRMERRRQRRYSRSRRHRRSSILDLFRST